MYINVHAHPTLVSGVSFLVKLSFLSFPSFLFCLFFLFLFLIFIIAFNRDKMQLSLYFLIWYPMHKLNSAEFFDATKGCDSLLCHIPVTGKPEALAWRDQFGHLWLWKSTVLRSGQQSAESIKIKEKFKGLGFLVAPFAWRSRSALVPPSLPTPSRLQVKTCRLVCDRSKDILRLA